MVPSISDFSKTHLTTIKEFVAINPQCSLAELAEGANDLTALATCPTRITVDVLLALGYAEPLTATETTLDQRPPAGGGQLTPALIRRQLEARHEVIESRIVQLLAAASLSVTNTKVLEMLAKMDDKVLNQLLDLMNDDAAPLLPQAIIILCLIQLGVSEDDVQTIEAI